MLIPASALVNGTTIVQETDLVEDLLYLHIELDRHGVILAEGAPSESFIDIDSRGLFDNAAEYSALYPQASDGATLQCAPRIDEGYELESVRRRLRNDLTVRAT
jgi:hypothetical protein